MKGKEINMAAIIARNEKEIAVGNGRMNARGDILGKGGEVITKRETVIQEYYKNTPNAVKNVSIADIKEDVFETPQQAIARLERQAEEQRLKNQMVSATPEQEAKPETTEEVAVKEQNQKKGRKLVDKEE